MTAADKEKVTEAVDDIAYHARELAGKCRDLATFGVPANEPKAAEIRRAAKTTAVIMDAVEDAFGNLPRLDGS